MTEREGDDLDELLQPTVTQAAPSGHLPWRLHSQFWVAFFGGIPAVTAIAWINARYLGMTVPAPAAPPRWRSTPVWQAGYS